MNKKFEILKILDGTAAPVYDNIRDLFCRLKIELLRGLVAYNPCLESRHSIARRWTNHSFVLNLILISSNANMSSLYLRNYGLLFKLNAIQINAVKLAKADKIDVKLL